MYNNALYNISKDMFSLRISLCLCFGNQFEEGVQSFGAVAMVGGQRDETETGINWTVLQAKCRESEFSLECKCASCFTISLLPIDNINFKLKMLMEYGLH